MTNGCPYDEIFSDGEKILSKRCFFRARVL